MDAPTKQVSECLILILGARVTKINQKLCDGVLSNACHPNGCTDTISFNKSGNHLGALLFIQLIHAAIMLERSSIVNKKILPMQHPLKKYDRRLVRHYELAR